MTGNFFWVRLFFFLHSMMKDCRFTSGGQKNLHKRPPMWALALKRYAKTLNRELVRRGIHGPRKLEEEMKTENCDFTVDEMEVGKERPC